MKLGKCRSRKLHLNLNTWLSKTDISIQLASLQLCAQWRRGIILSENRKHELMCTVVSNLRNTIKGNLSSPYTF